MKTRIALFAAAACLTLGVAPAMAQFGGAAAAGKGYLFDGTGALAYDPVLDLGPLP